MSQFPFTGLHLPTAHETHNTVKYSEDDISVTLLQYVTRDDDVSITLFHYLLVLIVLSLVIVTASL